MKKSQPIGFENVGEIYPIRKYLLTPSEGRRGGVINFCEMLNILFRFLRSRGKGANSRRLFFLKKLFLNCAGKELRHSFDKLLPKIAISFALHKKSKKKREK